MQALDFFQKVSSDVRHKSATGGAVTVITLVFMAFLISAETISFFSSSVLESVMMDRSFGGKLSINVDILFPSTSCRFINFDAVDSTGEEVVAANDIKKQHVRNPAAKLKEGCRMHGSIKLNKMDGNFHFALGKGVPGTAMGSSMSTDPFARKLVGAQHQHRFDMFELRMFNASHVIKHLSFGENVPGAAPQPLSGKGKSVASGMGQYNYYLSIVPVVYTTQSGREVRTNRYTYTEKVVEVESTATRFPHPGVFIYINISPLQVHLTEENKSFLHFMTNLCAIVGCMWVVSSFAESLVQKIVDGLASVSSSSSSSSSSSYS